MRKGSTEKAKRGSKIRIGARASGLSLALLVLGLVILYINNNRSPNILFPTPVLPTDNAYDAFLRAGKMANGMRHLTPVNMPDPIAKARTFRNYQAAAQDFTPALAVIHNVLAKPCLCPPVRTTSGLYSNLALFRNLARNCSGSSYFEQLVAHYKQAADIALDDTEMSEMITRGGTLAISKTALDCEAICLYYFEDLLPHLSAAELQQVALRMEQIQAKHVPFPDIVLEDGNASAAVIQEALWKPGPSSHNASALEIARNTVQSDSSKMPTLQEAIAITKFVLTSKEAMLLQVLEYHRAVAREAQQPYRSVSQVPVPDNYFAKLDAKFLSDTRTRFVRQEAVFAILRTEVALWRYKAKYHHYPDTLTQLTPTYLSVVLDDPFGGAVGKPLHYRVSPDGNHFVLYSVGTDMRDDGGIAPMRTRSAPDTETGDILAGHLWSWRT